MVASPLDVATDSETLANRPDEKSRRAISHSSDWKDRRSGHCREAQRQWVVSHLPLPRLRRPQPALGLESAGDKNREWPGGFCGWLAAECGAGRYECRLFPPNIDLLRTKNMEG